ncbi:hypothetical protein BC831DRAFT_453493 [Entophlyctis helioformis]|nr:hypothetical protein BC831DRAFT_453493 [Entophlyctis helioformis]
MTAITRSASSVATEPPASASVRRTPASGRVWKTVQHKPNSYMKAKGEKLGWEKRQEDRKKMGVLKAMKAEIERERTEALEKKKKENAERKKRKEENERRAEVVQQVSAAKVRRMKKKQLRQIRKK